MSLDRIIAGLRYRKVPRRDRIEHDDGTTEPGEQYTALKCARCETEFAPSIEPAYRGYYPSAGSHLCIPRWTTVGGRGVDFHRLGLDPNASLVEQLESMATILMDLAAYHRDLENNDAEYEATARSASGST